MYDRTVKPIPEPTTTGLRNRIENLLGITGLKMAKYRVSWAEAILSPFRLVWRPHLLMMLIFEVCAYNSECTYDSEFTSALRFGYVLLIHFGILF